MASPAFVQSSIASSYSGGKMTLSLPVIATAGNLLVASSWSFHSYSISAPAGWATTESVVNGTAAKLVVFTKISDGTEVGIVISGYGGGPVGSISEWSGAALGSVTSANKTQNATNTMYLIGPTDSPASDQALPLVLIGFKGGASGFTISSTPPWTSVFTAGATYRTGYVYGPAINRPVEDSFSATFSGSTATTWLNLWLEPAGVAPTINSGIANWTESGDVQSASGTSKSSGSAAFSDAPDLFSATGSSKSSAAANWSDGDDVLAGQAKAIATALAAWIENDDVLAASVTAISAGVVYGSASWTEAGDISAALASSRSSGAVYWAEDGDVSSAAIVITNTGNASWTEESETSSAVVTLSISGSAEWIEASDVLSAFVFSGEAEIIKPNQKLTILGKQRLRTYIGEARKRDFAGKSRMRKTE